MGKTDPDADRHRQQSMILVPRDTPGVEVVRGMEVFGYDDHDHGGHAELALRPTCGCPASNLIGEEGERLRHRPGPPRPRPHPPLHALDRHGRARHRADVPRAASERVAFGKPLAEQGVVRDWIAESRVRDRAAAAARAQDRLADGHRRQPGRAHRDPGDQDRHARRPSQWILDKAIQVHGAGGLSARTSRSPQPFAGIRTLRFADGPDEVHKNALAKAELRRYAAR